MLNLHQGILCTPPTSTSARGVNPLSSTLTCSNTRRGYRRCIPSSDTSPLRPTWKFPYPASSPAPAKQPSTTAAATNDGAADSGPHSAGAPGDRATMGAAARAGVKLSEESAEVRRLKHITK